MSSKTSNEIINKLKENPMSISDVKRALNIDWRTASNNLKKLEDSRKIFQSNHKNKKVYYLREEGNYFNLPLKTETKSKILKLYSQIRTAYKALHDKEPHKKQVYKTLYLYNPKLTFWYKYGPCSLVKYEEVELAKSYREVKETVQKYGKYSSNELTKIIYKDNPLYELKQELEELLKSNVKNHPDKLMDLISLVPEEAVETTTDMCRTFLSRGYDNELFEQWWNYIAEINARDQLVKTQDYAYKYLNHRIEREKSETQKMILDIVRSKKPLGK